MLKDVFFQFRTTTKRIHHTRPFIAGEEDSEGLLFWVEEKKRC